MSVGRSALAITGARSVVYSCACLVPAIATRCSSGQTSSRTITTASSISLAAGEERTRRRRGRLRGPVRRVCDRHEEEILALVTAASCRLAEPSPTARSQRSPTTDGRSTCETRSRRRALLGLLNARVLSHSLRLRWIIISCPLGLIARI